MIIDCSDRYRLASRGPTSGAGLAESRAGRYNCARRPRSFWRIAMQMVKIQIPDREDCKKGFAAMIRRGRVDCYRDNVFIVPEPALELLEDLEVRYLELGRGGL